MRVEETFGEDPHLVSRRGVAYVLGLQGRGRERFDARHMLAIGKHFLGYRESAGGLNGAYANVSPCTLYEVHLLPFAAAIKEAGLGSMMPGHTDLNGTPALASGPADQLYDSPPDELPSISRRNAVQPFRTTFATATLKVAL